MPIMKTTIHRVPTMTPEAFVKRHKLMLCIRERAYQDVGCWYAYLDAVEVKEGHILSSPSGNGATPALATAAYWARISE